MWHHLQHLHTVAVDQLTHVKEPIIWGPSSLRTLDSQYEDIPVLPCPVLPAGQYDKESDSLPRLSSSCHSFRASAQFLPPTHCCYASAGTETLSAGRADGEYGNVNKGQGLAPLWHLTSLGHTTICLLCCVSGQDVVEDESLFEILVLYCLAQHILENAFFWGSEVSECRVALQGFGVLNIPEISRWSHSVCCVFDISNTSWHIYYVFGNYWLVTYSLTYYYCALKRTVLWVSSASLTFLSPLQQLWSTDQHLFSLVFPWFSSQLLLIAYSFCVGSYD